MTKVCRLCLIKLQRGSKYFNINAVESFTGFMPYRDQLTTCIPEMALDLIPNPVICNTCRSALKAAYDFKTRCLFVEKKIQQYIEGQNYNENNEINYDLSQIPTDDVPPLTKLTMLVPKGEAVDTEYSILPPEKFLKIQSDETSPEEANEQEIENTESVERPEQDGESMSVSDSNISLQSRRTHKHRTYPRGRLSVSRIYGAVDEFVCNFCHNSFRSLQCLRKHNNICSKSNQAETTKNILTKRPHLPTKAKNHLKKWLFKHTDHPYPTDQEKQMLMQETNLSLLQVENWFINARRRILQDLTKLKSMRGLRSEDLCDSSLGFELDFEELVPQNTVVNKVRAKKDRVSWEGNVDPLDLNETPLKPAEVVDLPGPPENMVKEEVGDLEEEEIVDLAKVKCEVVDNR